NIGIRIHYSRFDQTKIEVPMGVPVTFTLVNDDPIEHEWLIGDEAFHARHRTGTEAVHGDRPNEVSLPPFATKTTTLTFDKPGAVAPRSAPAASQAVRLSRPAPYHGDPPVLLRAVPEAGTFTSRAGRWRYDGVRGALEQVAAVDEPLEHPAPVGTLVAVERQTRTPGGFAISNALAIRDAAGGP